MILVKWVPAGVHLLHSKPETVPFLPRLGLSFAPTPVIPLADLTELVERLRPEFWSYEQRLCEQERAGLTREQQTGAGIALDWVKQRLLTQLEAHRKEG